METENVEERIIEIQRNNPDFYFYLIFGNIRL